MLTARCILHQLAVRQSRRVATARAQPVGAAVSAAEQLYAHDTARGDAAVRRQAACVLAGAGGGGVGVRGGAATGGRGQACGETSREGERREREWKRGRRRNTDHWAKYTAGVDFTFNWDRRSPTTRSRPTRRTSTGAPGRDGGRRASGPPTAVVVVGDSAGHAVARPGTHARPADTVSVCAATADGRRADACGGELCAERERAAGLCCGRGVVGGRSVP